MEQRKVLVVDDEAQIRKVLTRHLEKEGYAVNTAQDGSEALELIRKDPPDLVISDLKMPEMTGVQLLEEIRKFAPQLPFILLSSAATPEEVERARQLGISDYIPKPFDFDDLMKRVAKS